MRITKHIFLISLFCFFSSAYSQIDHWETVVYEDDTWDYLVPTSAVDPSWRLNGFNAIGWSSGPGGFGYGDGDENTILPNGTTSCFQRIEFNITDTSDITIAALSIDYDDSFVAFLNGTEISRDLLLGNPPAWNNWSTGLHEAQMYQGGYPAQYTLNQAFIQANLLNGTNTLAIQTHNQSNTSSDMSSRVWLHLGIKTGSSNYGATPTWFVPPFVFTESNLPIVVVNTDLGLTIPDEPKIDAEMGIIWNGDGNMNYITDPFNEFYGDIGIERRGSSSQSFPKKPYSVETRGPDSSNYNASIFNWPADNDWALIAPYSDKSLIRNVLTYKLGNETGHYTPRTKLCELVLNGEYQGVYVFTEKIKQGSGRVDVDKIEYNDTNADEITGGYIVKIDKTTGGEPIAWTSPFAQAPPATGPIHYQLHDPELDSLHPLQQSYIQSYITNFETALDAASFTDPIIGYRPFIDVGSFIDFMLINEISKNVDGYRISTFYHKQHISDGGKLVAGPLWDFNLAWGNANYCDGGLTTGWEIYFNDVCGGGGSLNNPFHWNRLVQDPDYTHELNCRWQELRQDILHEDSLLLFIDEQAVLLNDAATRNFTKWPTLGSYVWPNNFVGNTYQEEIDYLKSWTSARIQWMDNNMFGSCPDLQSTEFEFEHISVWPNPTEQEFNIMLQNNSEADEIRLVDMSGRVLIKNSINGQQHSMDVSNLSTGMYLIEILNESLVIGYETVIKN